MQDALLVKAKPRDIFIEVFDAWVQQKMDSCHCPGAAVTIVTDSTIRLIKGYGVRSTDTDEPVDMHTVFRLASVSKNFASALAAIMVEKGLIHYEDPLVKYLPAFEFTPKEFSDEVTIDNILSQSSGLPYHCYTNLVESGMALSDIIPLFKQVKVPFAPGTEYAYQNAVYACIEPVLEKATHQSYAALFQEYLVDPLCMTDMSFDYACILNGKDVALPHTMDQACICGTVKPISNKYYNTTAAGGLNASISDMSKWMKALLGNNPDVLSKSALDSMLRPRIRTSQDRRYYNYWPGVQETYYANGMRVLDYGDHLRFYHGGYANDYRAEIAFDRDKKIAICALFNSTCQLANDIVPEFFSFYDQWHDSILVEGHSQLKDTLNPNIQFEQ